MLRIMFSRKLFPPNSSLAMMMHELRNLFARRKCTFTLLYFVIEERKWVTEGVARPLFVVFVVIQKILWQS